MLWIHPRARVRSIELDSEFGFSGKVVVDRADAVNWSLRDGWAFMVATLAGAAGELLYTERVRTGNIKADLQKIPGFLRFLQKEDKTLSNPWHIVHPGTGLRPSSMYAKGLLNYQQREAIDAAFYYCRLYVQSNAPAVENLAMVLYENKTLSAEEITKELGPQL